MRKLRMLLLLSASATLLAVLAATAIAATNSVQHAVRGEVELFSPLAKGFPDSVHFDENACLGFISVLGVDVSPAAVARAIRPVVVDPVNGVPCRRSGPHIGEESGEFSPSRADVYPPSAVSSIHLVGGVRASGAHTRPSAVLRGPAMTVGFPAPSSKFLRFEAPARARFPPFESRGKNLSFGAAVAHAGEHPVMPTGRFGYDSPPMESLAGGE